MGGQRSTRWNGHEARRLVEHTFRIDLLHPQLSPLLQDPALSTWTSTITTGRATSRWLAVLSASEPDGSRDLTLRSLPLDIHEPGEVIQLEPVVAGFHERVLAECPSCNRRAQILHALPKDGIFQCRRCLALAYRSSREWDKRISRLSKAMLRGDEAIVRQWEARGTLPGYAGMAADIVYLRAVDRAFPGQLADGFGKSLGQRQDFPT